MVGSISSVFVGVLERKAHELFERHASSGTYECVTTRLAQICWRIRETSSWHAHRSRWKDKGVRVHASENRSNYGALMFFEMRDRLYRRHRTGDELFRALDRDRDGFVCSEDFVALLSGGTRGPSGQSSSSSYGHSISLANRMIAPIDLNYDPVLRLPPSQAAAMFMQVPDHMLSDGAGEEETMFSHGFVDLSTFSSCCR